MNWRRWRDWVCFSFEMSLAIAVVRILIEGFSLSDFGLRLFAAVTAAPVLAFVFVGIGQFLTARTLRPGRRYEAISLTYRYLLKKKSYT